MGPDRLWDGEMRRQQPRVRSHIEVAGLEEEKVVMSRNDRRIDRPLSTEQRSTNLGQWGCRAQQPSRSNQTRLRRRLRLELVGYNVHGNHT
jgi:hypothetical protein